MLHIFYQIIFWYTVWKICAINEDVYSLLYNLCFLFLFLEKYSMSVKINLLYNTPDLQLAQKRKKFLLHCLKEFVWKIIFLGLIKNPFKWRIISMSYKIQHLWNIKWNYKSTMKFQKWGYFFNLPKSCRFQVINTYTLF